MAQSQPSAVEQYMLELVNAERAKAGAQPLAFNLSLNDSAETHSRWMLATDTFSHSGADGSSAGDRMKAAGYAFTGSWSWGENLALRSLAAPEGLRDETDGLHTQLMNSAGHRANILNSGYREIGIGIEADQYTTYQAATVTQNFARSGSGSFLTGVAFDDKDGDRAYDPGEGLGGLTVTVAGASGSRFTATTMEAGGYQLKLPADTYTVTFSGAGIEASSRQVTIGSQNAKVDLVDPAAASGPVVAQPQPEPTPAPEPAPINKVMTGTWRSDTLAGQAGDDTISGLGGSDRLYGRDGADKLDGGSGADRLFGEAGNDWLLGGSSRDTLDGGAGNDRLYGGSDHDVFRFTGAWGEDVIGDFQNGRDVMDMRGNGLSFGKLAIRQTDLDGDGADDAQIAAGAQLIGLLNTKTAALDAGDFWF